MVSKSKPSFNGIKSIKHLRNLLGYFSVWSKEYFIESYSFLWQVFFLGSFDTIALNLLVTFPCFIIPILFQESLQRETNNGYDDTTFFNSYCLDYNLHNRL